MVDSEQELISSLECLCKSTARKKFRKDIKDSWNNQCAYCGSDEAYTLDHIQAKSKGGATRRHNLVACCGPCNLRKSDEDWFTWYRQQKFYSGEFELKIFQWQYADHDRFVSVKVIGVVFSPPPSPDKALTASTLS
tara:strand:+ start:1842 stop:2249 length:408 start_codon:yes stop_codon:yes gene_type:complete